MPHVFLHSPIANAAGHRLTERERGTSEKQNNSSTLRRRCVHSWFADRPFFRFSSHSLASAPRRFDFNHIRLANAALSLSFLPSSLFLRSDGTKSRGWRSDRDGGVGKEENGWREKGDEGMREAEFNFSHSRSSVSVRIFIPFRATTRPVISFAENSRGYLTPATLFPSRFSPVLLSHSLQLRLLFFICSNTTRIKSKVLFEATANRWFFRDINATIIMLAF